MDGCLNVATFAVVGLNVWSLHCGIDARCDVRCGGMRWMVIAVMVSWMGLSLYNKTESRFQNHATREDGRCSDRLGSIGSWFHTISFHWFYVPHHVALASSTCGPWSDEVYHATREDGRCSYRLDSLVLCPTLRHLTFTAFTCGPRSEEVYHALIC